ncbi:Retinaldehyde-binding protein 1 [Orchesella cincta]|uniref:Retinaldehyde-binding protein 1 n=1 Tax=Orchesella cincta TaxID=48709 RepID=A0A1D2M1R9_ORCCI|nr:Retinaldehyde-binding protein 1 [Orchesella cincta]
MHPGVSTRLISPQDDSLLLIYLRGRKHRVNQAFDTLKRKAEVRFDEYPEVFPEEVPDALSNLAKRGVYGLTKTRDKFGRRIICFNTGEWNPNELPFEEFGGAATHFYDKMILDKDVINNGLIIIQNCGGMGLKHARQYTLHNMLLILNVFCLAYPIKLKGLYYVNVPSYVKYLFKIIQPFLSKKLKERMVIMGTGKD